MNREKLAALILLSLGVVFLIIFLVLRLMAPVGGLVCMPPGSQCQYYYDGTTIPIAFLVSIFFVLGALTLLAGFLLMKRYRQG